MMEDRKRVWLDIHRRVLLAALWEQRLFRFIEEGLTSGFYHAGRGQEAIAAGVCAALRADDYLLYDHRGLGPFSAPVGGSRVAWEPLCLL